MRKNIPCVLLLLSTAFHGAGWGPTAPFLPAGIRAGGNCRKNLLPALFVLAIFSCSESSRTISEPFPDYLTKDVDWITYEGVLPSENGQPILTELHLVPGTPGLDSYYRIQETFHGIHNGKPFSNGTHSRGKYSVLFGSPDHNIIQIISKQKVSSVFRQGLTMPDRMTENMYLKSYGDHELVLVDKHFREVVPRHFLIRRSELFTVEGYFTVYGDTTEFFERNTRKTWPVAQLAYYDEAVRKYDQLAKEKFEGVYLKALSYSITQTDQNGKESDALVFKEILLMDSMPSNNF